MKGEKATRFSSVLENAQEGQVPIGTEYSDLGDSGNLEAILDEIFAIGERVKENPTQDRVRNYKGAVKALIKRVVEQGLAVEERQSSPNILRQKRFTLVKIIDDKLEKLAASVLINQRDTLDVLGRIDEINGLLVDLVG